MIDAQVTHVFCGIAVFSREKFDESQAWIEATSNQRLLFEDAPDVSPSRNSRSAFRYSELSTGGTSAATRCQLEGETGTVEAKTGKPTQLLDV